MKTATERSVNDDVFWEIALKTDPMSPEEELAAAKIIQTGKESEAILAAGGLTAPQLAKHKRLAAKGQKTKTDFIASNLKLALSRYPKFWSRLRALEPEDLLAEATIAMHRAIDKFDWTLGYKFSTYASRWIDGHLGAVVATQGFASKIPKPVQENMRLQTRSWSDKHGGVPLSQIRSMASPAQLDRPLIFADNENSTLRDTIADTSEEAPGSRMTGGLPDLLAAMQTLIEDPLDYEAVCLKLGLTGEEPMTYKEVADRLGFGSGQAVATRYLAAIDILREEMPRELIADLL